ncbi:MAG: type II toxin-antitoxin system RelE/ParE family toxin [Oscillospiraceae bacterium]
MRYNITMTVTARTDIQSAVQYISAKLKNKPAAVRLLDETDKKIGILADDPYINPLVRDSFLAANGVRLQMVGKYTAFYIINEETKTVSVIRFQHSRRNWSDLLKNDI